VPPVRLSDFRTDGIDTQASMFYGFENIFCQIVKHLLNTDANLRRDATVV